MNKTQLIDLVAVNTGLSKTDCKKVLDALVNATLQAIKKGEDVTIRGFGSFLVSKKNPSKIKNSISRRVAKKLTIPDVVFEPSIQFSCETNFNGTSDSGALYKN